MTTNGMTKDQAHELAEDLIADLYPLAGDQAATDARLLRLVDEHQMKDVTLVGLAALRLIFGSYLTPIPTSEAPPGALGLTHDRSAA